MASRSDSRSSKKSTKTNSNVKTDTSLINNFANDGSFFEIYKQRLKEQESGEGDKQEVEKKEIEKRKTATNLMLQGKRKIPVGRMPGSSKQLGAKKKKQEKAEKKKEEEHSDEKSSAWKAYMEEVRKYKEMSCTDDSEQSRPLVK